MRAAVALLAAVFPLSSGCGGTQVTADVVTISSMPTCFTLSYGSVPPSAFPDTNSDFHFIPDSIQLHADGAVTPKWRGFVGVAGDSIGGRWKLVSRDSLEVEWSTGMGGVSLFLARHGPLLLGRAAAGMSDVAPAPAWDTIAVQARRLPCSRSR